MKNKSPFELAQSFHQQFDDRIPSYPTAFLRKEVSARAGFKVEELVEFLYSVAENDEHIFSELVDQLKDDVDQAKQKIVAKQKEVREPLVDQIDALTDLLYFTYGSFALLGVDPAPIFSIVHKANMGKLFPDGMPHYHPVTHKVLKPDNWEKEYAPEPKIKKELDRQTKQAQSQ